MKCYEGYKFCTTKLEKLRCSHISEAKIPYDKKAKASPLHAKDHCFILQANGGRQGSKIPNRDFRLLPNENYTVLKIKTDKNQFLHRIRFCNFTTDVHLEDRYTIEKIRPVDDIVNPQDHLYSIDWEAETHSSILHTPQNLPWSSNDSTPK